MLKVSDPLRPTLLEAGRIRTLCTERGTMLLSLIEICVYEIKFICIIYNSWNNTCTRVWNILNSLFVNILYSMHFLIIHHLLLFMCL